MEHRDLGNGSPKRIYAGTRGLPGGGLSVPREFGSGRGDLGIIP